MKIKQLFLGWLSLFLLCTPLLAQFVEVQGEIKADRLPDKERRDLKTLEQEIPHYYENYNWMDNKYNIQLPIKINIFPQSVNTKGSQRLFTGQLFITTASGDQRFFEKNFKFVYNTNAPLTHSNMVTSLTGTLDFYGYMLLAGEMDTYEPLGGNTLYERARDIATRGQISEQPYGWGSRLQELNEILKLRNYRLFKYHFWQIIDLEEYGDTEEIPAVIDQALKDLENIFQINARERYIHVFLDVHAREFMSIIKTYGNKAQQQKLIELNPDNKKLYQNILKQ